MHCENCSQLFKRRAAYIYHLSKCKSNFQMVDEDPSSAESSVDDSDADSTWSPNAEDANISTDDEQPTSPLTAEQVQTAYTAEKLLLDVVSPGFVPEQMPPAGQGPHLPAVSEIVPPIHSKTLCDMGSVKNPEIVSTLESETQITTDHRSELPQISPLPEYTNAHSIEPTIQQSTGMEPLPTISATDSESQNCVELSVDLSRKKDTEKHVWNRRDFCIFCEKMITNFTRHITRNHSNELQVSKILAYKKGSGERRLLFEELKRKGNFHNNSSCLREQKGTIVVVRRPTTNTDVSKYLPCRLCYGYFSKSRLYRHLKECKLRNGNQHVPTKNAQSFASTLTMVNNECCPELKNKIFTVMRNDAVTDTVKKDSLICAYGSRLMKTRQDKHMRTIISQKMRELGRLLMHLKSKHVGINELQEFIKPEHYATVVSSVQEISGFNPLNGSFKVPTLATKIGHSLRTCADIIQCIGISKNNSTLEQSAKKFETMMEKQWQYDISVNASRTLYKAKYNKPVLLPVAKDLKLLQSYIAKKEEELMKDLKLTLTEEVWRTLSEVLLTHLILLNRRRAGEAERIKLVDYVGRAKKEHNEDIFNSLTNIEKTLCQSLTRFETRGKRGRRVPVLLTPSMKQIIDILIDTREVVGVLPQNPYLFALPQTEDSTLRGTTVLHKYATLCGAKNPETLTSTKLRKHIATMSQLLHLTTGDMEQLSGFMGHNLAIHKQYYRLPENTVQVAKMSKILLMIEKGQLTDFNGKSIDELNIDFENPVSDLSSEDEQEDTAMQSPDIDFNNHEQQLDCPVKELPHVSNSPYSVEAFNNTLISSNTHVTTANKSHPIKKRRQTSKKVPWSDEEKSAVIKHFEKHILLKKVPNKKECDNVLAVESILSGRSWKHVKFCVKNMFQK